jgi:hypothetical protein
VSADKELIEILSRLNVSLSRVDRGNFLNFMLTQQMAERATPTNSEFGSAIVGSVAIQWTQILQRNDRRKYVELVFSNANFFLVNDSDVSADALELATQVNNAANNVTDLMLSVALYSSNSLAPQPIRIETSGPLYVASFDINGSGGPIVTQGVVTWQEAIFSDIAAIPGFMVEHRAKAGDVDKLTPGTLEESIIGHEFESAYGRGGVR